MTFISLEGIDGSGKSTQARLLAEALGPETLLVREPGGTVAAERIRDLLGDPSLEIDPLAELLLFSAARADLLAALIRPALAAGRNVVADRFGDSSVAYTAIDGLWPDVTVYLRIDPEVGMGRAAGDDRFEAEGLALQQAVAEAYDEIAAIASDRVATVDATGTVDEVQARVMEAVESRG
jgi:dTMP kinase